MIKMIVKGLTMDPSSNSPILILQDTEGQQSLPIWIGLLEATAIASELEEVQFSRPMTHDLLRNVIGSMGGSVTKVEVCDLKDNTFYALIHLTGPQGELVIDSRPSDAIAVALRTKAPIFVAEKVLESSQAAASGQGQEAEEKWRDILESMDPDDFGKYKM